MFGTVVCVTSCIVVVVVVAVGEVNNVIQTFYENINTHLTN